MLQLVEQNNVVDELDNYGWKQKLGIPFDLEENNVALFPFFCLECIHGCNFIFLVVRQDHTEICLIKLWQWSILLFSCLANVEVAENYLSW